MPDEERVLVRNETEQYIIKECFSKQYSSADGGREARFRLAQNSVAGLLAHTSDPLKKAELAGTLNSLRAFSGEFAKYAENRALYNGAKQIYDEYLTGPGSSDGSMLVPAEINGERVRIKAEDLADIAYVCEQRILNAVKSRSEAARQEFGAERISGGVDFYGLTTTECADAVLGYAENVAAGKAPQGAVQEAFAALNKRVAEKRAGMENSRGVPSEKPPETEKTPESEKPPENKSAEQTAQQDIREQLSRAMERIAALEEQNRQLSEQNRKLGRAESKPVPQRSAAADGVIRERISFQQLLAEAGVRRTLTTPDSIAPEKDMQKQPRIL